MSDEWEYFTEADGCMGWRKKKSEVEVSEPFDSEGNVICTKCKQKLLDMEIFGMIRHECASDKKKRKMSQKKLSFCE